MGSSGSKTAKTVAGAAQRKYPSRTSALTNTQQTSPPGPSSQVPPPHTQDVKVVRDASAASRGTMPGSETDLDGNRDRRRQPPPSPPPGAQRQASGSKDQGIELDGRDPQFAAHLRTLGPVQPNPTYSPSSTSSPSNTTSDPSASSDEPLARNIPSAAPNTMSPNPATTPSPRNNPALAILAARQRIQDEEERDKAEAGRSGFGGRRYVDVGTIRTALLMRDEQGMRAEEIEKTLRLRKGFMACLGRQGVIEAT